MTPRGYTRAHVYTVGRGTCWFGADVSTAKGCQHAKGRGVQLHDGLLVDELVDAAAVSLLVVEDVVLGDGHGVALQRLKGRKVDGRFISSRGRVIFLISLNFAYYKLVVPDTCTPRGGCIVPYVQTRNRNRIDRRPGTMVGQLNGCLSRRRLTCTPLMSGTTSVRPSTGSSPETYSVRR